MVMHPRTKYSCECTVKVVSSAMNKLKNHNRSMELDYLTTKFGVCVGGGPCGIVTTMLNCDIVVSEI